MKWRPARSFDTTAVLGAEGSSRVQRIVSGSLHLANVIWPLRYENAELAKVADCRCFFALKRGYLARLAKKFLKADY